MASVLPFGVDPLGSFLPSDQFPPRAGPWGNGRPQPRVFCTSDFDLLSRYHNIKVSYSKEKSINFGSSMVFLSFVVKFWRPEEISEFSK